MFGGNVQEDGEPLIGPPLVFRRDVQGHMLPAVQPIPGQTRPDAVGPLGQEEEVDVGALADHVPHLVPPWVRLFQKKVAGHAHPERFSALDFIVALSVLFQGQIEVGFDLVNVPAKSVPLAVLVKHVAVVAALAELAAAVPGVPDIPAHGGHSSFLQGYG